MKSINVNFREIFDIVSLEEYQESSKQTCIVRNSFHRHNIKNALLNSHIVKIDVIMVQSV